jgi:hypothetical protein
MNPSSHDDVRIAAELSALGEPAHARPETAPADDPDVAVVAALFGLAHGARPELSELERRRVWRRLEAMRAPARPHAPAGGLGSLWIGLAAAIALLLVPVFAPGHAPRGSDPDERAALAAAGQLARRSLGDLAGGQDRERARATADAYAARLHGDARAVDGGVR